MKISTLLFIISVPVFAVYFYQFGKTMKLLDEGESKRYVEKASSKLGLASMLISFGAFYYFNDLKVKAALAVGIAMLLAVGTYVHHQKLRLLKFDAAFETRLLKVSYLSGIGIVLILMSGILDSHAT